MSTVSLNNAPFEFGKQTSSGLDQMIGCVLESKLRETTKNSPSAQNNDQKQSYHMKGFEDLHKRSKHVSADVLQHESSIEGPLDGSVIAESKKDQTTFKGDKKYLESLKPIKRKRSEDNSYSGGNPQVKGRQSLLKKSLTLSEDCPLLKQPAMGLQAVKKAPDRNSFSRRSLKLGTNEELEFRLQKMHTVVESQNGNDGAELEEEADSNSISNSEGEEFSHKFVEGLQESDFADDKRVEFMLKVYSQLDENQLDDCLVPRISATLSRQYPSIGQRKMHVREVLTQNFRTHLETVYNDREKLQNFIFEKFDEIYANYHELHCKQFLVVLFELSEMNFFASELGDDLIEKNLSEIMAEAYEMSMKGRYSATDSLFCRIH